MSVPAIAAQGATAARDSADPKGVGSDARQRLAANPFDADALAERLAEARAARARALAERTRNAPLASEDGGAKGSGRAPAPAEVVAAKADAASRALSEPYPGVRHDALRAVRAVPAQVAATPGGRRTLPARDEARAASPFRADDGRLRLVLAFASGCAAFGAALAFAPGELRREFAQLIAPEPAADPEAMQPSAEPPLVAEAPDAGSASSSPTRIANAPAIAPPTPPGDLVEGDRRAVSFPSPTPASSARAVPPLKTAALRASASPETAVLDQLSNASLEPVPTPGGVSDDVSRTPGDAIVPRPPFVDIPDDRLAALGSVAVTGPRPRPTLPAPDPRAGADPDRPGDVGMPEPAAPAPPSVSQVAARVFVHYPQTAESQAAAVVDRIKAMETEAAAIPASFSVSRTNVRYFHAADREAAQAVARALSPSQEAGPAETRDFTDFRPQPSPGTVEVWLAGVAPASAPAAPRTSGAASVAPPPVAAPPRAAAPRVVQQARELDRPTRVVDLQRLEGDVERRLQEQLRQLRSR